MKQGSLEPGQLAGALLSASDWLNDGLLERLAAQGWPRLNRSQSQVFRQLARGVDRPAALAREVGMARQSMSTLLRSLAELDLVALGSDPDDRRALTVGLTPRGTRLVVAAAAELRALEFELAAHLGEDEVDALRRILGRPWPPRGVTAAGSQPG